jgi:hypothetical protein
LAILSSHNSFTYKARLGQSASYILSPAWGTNEYALDLGTNSHYKIVLDQMVSSKVYAHLLAIVLYLFVLSFHIRLLSTSYVCGLMLSTQTSDLWNPCMLCSGQPHTVLPSGNLSTANLSLPADIAGQLGRALMVVACRPGVEFGVSQMCVFFYR